LTTGAITGGFVLALRGGLFSRRRAFFSQNRAGLELTIVSSHNASGHVRPETFHP